MMYPNRLRKEMERFQARNGSVSGNAASAIPVRASEAIPGGRSALGATIGSGDKCAALTPRTHKSGSHPFGDGPSPSVPPSSALPAQNYAATRALGRVHPNDLVRALVEILEVWDDPATDECEMVARLCRPIDRVKKWVKEPC